MALTLLFDLDDTLLDTNTSEFLPAYFQSLGKSLSHLASTETLTQQIKAAVQQMVANRDPGKMLDEIFAENFYIPLGTTEANCRETLDLYYQQVYPGLHSVTQQKPDAKALVAWCQSMDMTLAIATNPLFPENATRQRIEWAGLNPEDFDFFSAFDDFHFTKPNLTYYAECLGRLGWPEETVVMVGDNLTHDLLPFEQLGYPAFWVNPTATEDARPLGRLTEVKPWLEKIAKDSHYELTDSPDVDLAILRSTPAVIDSWLRIMSSEILFERPTANEWSIVEVLWHIADIENEIYLPQWEHLLMDTKSPISPPDSSNWAIERNYSSRNPQIALEVLLKSRRKSLALIEELILQDLMEISIQHTVFSHAKIAELVSFAAKHDRIHLRQCKNLLDIYKNY